VLRPGYSFPKNVVCVALAYSSGTKSSVSILRLSSFHCSRVLKHHFEDILNICNAFLRSIDVRHCQFDRPVVEMLHMGSNPIRIRRRCETLDRDRSDQSWSGAEARSQHEVDAPHMHNEMKCSGLEQYKTTMIQSILHSNKFNTSCIKNHLIMGIMPLYKDYV
jgi:hypothetical protein